MLTKDDLANAVAFMILLVLTVGLFILKLTAWQGMSWWWVPSPFLISWGFGIIIRFFTHPE